MRRRTKWMAGLGIVAVGAIAAVLWYFVFSEADDPVSLEEAIGAATQPAPTSTADSPQDTAEETVVDSVEETTPAAGIDGLWTIAPQLDSFVGYRVQEDLDPIGSNTATGRTGAVTGELVIDDTTVTEVAVVADVTQLQSDRSTRDRALRSRGLESSTFPEAEFVLVSPFDFGPAPEEGETVVASVMGELTAHGVTQPVVAQLEAQLVEGVIAVVGTIDVVLSDFEISGLTGFAVLSVEDEAQVEFQLLFSR